MMTRLIPKVFFNRMSEGLDLFVDCLGFKVLYQDGSMAVVERNDVRDSLGVGIFCGDYSECEIDDNSVRGIRVDHASGDTTRLGFGILAHSGAKAVLSDNDVSDSPGGTRAVLDAQISREE